MHAKTWAPDVQFVFLTYFPHLLIVIEISDLVKTVIFVLFRQTKNVIVYFLLPVEGA